MRLLFYNARQHGDDESYVTWGLVDDGKPLQAFETWTQGVYADCTFAGVDHDDENCPYCVVYVNDDIEISDGQVLVAESGKRYRVTFQEVTEE